MAGHHIIILQSQEEVKNCLEKLGTDAGGYPYLVPKALFRCILLKDIKAPAANIIKQEMLAAGGDAAVNRQTILGQGSTDVLLMGTLKQYQKVMRKLKGQPFGLKKVAADLETILDAASTSPRQLRLAQGRSLKLGEGTLIMGILNVTPDSFSDGGRYYDTQQAVDHGLEMTEQGAHIIDVGGASSRPGAEIASEDEELRRVVPVVEKLVQQGVLVSVDTFRARVAQETLAAGAHLINDIGGLKLDPNLLPVLAEYQAGVVLMHNRLQINHGQPYADLVSDIIDELSQSVDQALTAGLPRDCLIIDPGIGFGKDAAQNRYIIKHLQEFRSLGLPVLLGASRKRFIGLTLGLEVDQRLEGSLAVAVAGALNGADMIRVHDVLPTVRAVRMADAIRMENG
ncbi:MAG TPA: dihydropteroate synthase [Syntrophomonadaceae bacterium]|nr:dihydropteroate synthase [Syntrophomonadaceae bacterium]HQA08081.1 dihydropteroate synthase [Syntrophomonadaceae bacterium]HQE23992.1 dihydropteroate synthase [Syntrophomonadaceae bacterium]